MLRQDSLDLQTQNLITAAPLPRGGFLNASVLMKSAVIEARDLGYPHG